MAAMCAALPALSQSQKPTQPQQQPAAQGNPFPGEDSNAPVLPTTNMPAPAEGDENLAASGSVPSVDSDPVRSPESSELMTTTPSGVDSMESSSLAGIDTSSTDDSQSGNPAAKSRANHSRKLEVPAPEHKETAQEDISVGMFYLDQKDWKGALSRFQSAMVLDPENPDVFFGLAEVERHMGKIQEARQHYQRVVDYDPDSKHGKQAKKALKELQAAK